MASHYGVGVLPARPRRPKDKAKVENGIRFAQTCILGRLRRQTFFSLAEAMQHAHERGIQIIGDIPIFVAFDSADVWRSPELFLLAEHRRGAAGSEPFCRRELAPAGSCARGRARPLRRALGAVARSHSTWRLVARAQGGAARMGLVFARAR